MSLTAWSLADAAVGNRRQADALAAALTDCVEPITLVPRAPWRWAAPRRWPGARRAFGADFAARLDGPGPELAIGCGRQAALATRLLDEAGCVRLQILDPRIDPRHWDAVIAPSHDRLDGANVIRTLGSLHAVDAAWLDAARSAWPMLAALPAPRTLLLLGGPTAAVPFGPADWRRLAAVLSRWLDRDGGSLLVSSSRRTPDWLRQAARTQFADVPGRQWHGTADGDNPYPGMLAWSERIVATADSVNLLSEACATGVPVCVPLPTRPHGRIAAFHRALLDSDRLRPLSTDFEPWQYPPLRETAAVAAELRHRFGWPLAGG